jgi:GxxExxY protein
MGMRLAQGVKEIRGGNARGEKYPFSELTEQIIGAAIAVHRALGAGFVESIYENAMAVELTRRNLPFERQKTVQVVYEGVVVGEHRADLLVDDKVVVELKAVSELAGVHEAQTMSTTKAFGKKIGLLINFNEARVIDGVRRFIL